MMQTVSPPGRALYCSNDDNLSPIPALLPVTPCSPATKPAVICSPLAGLLQDESQFARPAVMDTYPTHKNLPGFLGIGAQRAGTSWLYRQLCLHPEIWMPPVKELHYFDRSPHYASPNDLATVSLYARIFGQEPRQRARTGTGIKTIARYLAQGKIRQALWWSRWTFGFYNDDWYRRLFAQAASWQISGEITPSYSILEDNDIARMHKVNPEMKIIFLLRNPVERAWSAIRFHVLMGTPLHLDSPSEIKSVLEHPGMRLRGDYERTLAHYLKYFDTSQILICFYDAIRHDPDRLMADITAFLGVQPFAPTSINSETIVNKSPDHTIPDQVQEYLLETYLPMIGRMAKTLGSYPLLWEKAGNDSSMDLSQECSGHECAPTLHPFNFPYH